jgi:hypothetical protein
VLAAAMTSLPAFLYQGSRLNWMAGTRWLMHIGL